MFLLVIFITFYHFDHFPGHGLVYRTKKRRRTKESRPKNSNGSKYIESILMTIVPLPLANIENE